MTERMPVIYLSHGAPPLADDELWTEQLAGWAATLPRPRAVLMISAHWEAAPLTIGATTTQPLVYDFWGFADRYYDVTYRAPGAPDLARDVRGLLGDGATADEPTRGLDHGAYVPLKEMYPDADVPVLQVSMPSLSPQALFDVGARLGPLRDAGVLVVGSGFFTHNLSRIDMRQPSDVAAASWSAEFDDWGGQVLADGDVDALLDFERTAPAADIAHPRTEHFAPLFVAAGAAAATSSAHGATVIDGFWHGLAKRSVQFG